MRWFARVQESYDDCGRLVPTGQVSLVEAKEYMEVYMTLYTNPRLFRPRILEWLQL